MPGINPRELELLDAQISAQLDLLRHTNSVNADVLALLESMRRELVAKLSSVNLTEIGKARLKALLKDTSLTIDEYFKAAQAILSPSYNQVAHVAASQAVVGLPEVLTATVPGKAILQSLVSGIMIEGAPTAAWWAKMSSDTAFKFSNAVRQGIAQGETNEQIFKRVGEVTDLAERNSRALVHTSIMQVASDARLATIEANKDIYKGYRHLSTLDGNTSAICIARSNLEWDFNKEPIGHNLPFLPPPQTHWGCRSDIMGILRTYKELGIDIPEPEMGTRSSAEGQIPANTTFDAFLKRRTVEEQDAQLGKGRADMWRSGKITLRQLVDNKGKPMTLSALQAKYG